MALAPFSLLRPPSDEVNRIVSEHMDAPFSYSAVGETRDDLPRDWFTGEAARVVGRGEKAYRAAIEAMRGWRQFHLSWVWPLRSDVPIAVGSTFGFVARAVGVWTVNVCRVVYVVDEEDAEVARFGFAYGTVGAHSVQGEERFLIEWNKGTDEVTFGIRKFSRPSSWLFRLVGPLTRHIQARFTRNALDRLATEIAEAAD